MGKKLVVLLHILIFMNYNAHTTNDIIFKKVKIKFFDKILNSNTIKLKF